MFYPACVWPVRCVCVLFCQEENNPSHSGMSTTPQQMQTNPKSCFILSASGSRYLMFSLFQKWKIILFGRSFVLFWRDETSSSFLCGDFIVVFVFTGNPDDSNHSLHASRALWDGPDWARAVQQNPVQGSGWRQQQLPETLWKMSSWPQPSPWTDCQAPGTNEILHVFSSSSSYSAYRHRILTS